MRLQGLPAGVIGLIPASEEVRRLLREAAGMKGGARKRQIKYITKLLREEPLEETLHLSERQKGAALQEKKEFHELELYRDTLLNEAIEAHRNAESNGEEAGEEWPGRVIDEISAALPGVDRQVAGPPGSSSMPGPATGSTAGSCSGSCVRRRNKMKRNMAEINTDYGEVRKWNTRQASAGRVFYAPAR